MHMRSRPMIAVMVVSTRHHLVLSLLSPLVPTCAHLNTQQAPAPRAEVLDMGPIELVPLDLRNPAGPAHHVELTIPLGVN